MKIKQWQQECEDALRLDCSLEDIKIVPEARKLWKFLKKQRRYVNLVQRLEDWIIMR